MNILSVAMSQIGLLLRPWASVGSGVELGNRVAQPSRTKGLVMGPGLMSLLRQRFVRSLVVVVGTPALCSSSLGQNCEPACGDNVACLLPDEPERYENRRPVGRLVDQGCTGWIIAAPNFVITNRHCVTVDDQEVLDFPNGNYRFRLNQECDSCENSSILRTSDYQVEALVHSNPDLDYAILRVAGDPASDFGILPVSTANVGLVDGVYIIHHAFGGPKGYDSSYVITIPFSACFFDIFPGFESILSVRAGASGSPIFSADTNCVVGLSQCGGPNSFCVPLSGAVTLSAILEDALFEIESAGGIVSLCGDNPSCGDPGAGGCCIANGTPGCDNISCCITSACPCYIYISQNIGNN